MRQINRMLLGGVVLGISASALLASGPATQPVTPVSKQVDSVSEPADLLSPADPGSLPPVAPTPGATSPDDARIRRGDRMFSPLRPRPLDEKDLSDARLYMHTHSPERYNAILALPEGKEKSAIESLTAQRYLNWMRLARDDFELYAVVEKRIELEDAIFGKVRQLRTESSQAQDAAVKAQLKDLVGKLVDNGIRERQLRLDRLQRTIKQEQAKLAEDSANRPSVVEQRYNAILSSDTNGLLPAAGPGLGGGAQHGHGGGARPPQ